MPVDLMTLLSPKNLILFIVVFTRLSGMITTAPLISTYPIPIQIKVWFMALVAFIMFPIVMVKTGFPIPTSVPELTVILIKEFMIGYIIGFISQLVFVGVEIAAELVSMQMGLTAAQALNPMTGATSPILSQAYTILASMIFIGLNGYKWMFAALFKTFEILPPGYGFLINGTITHNVMFLTSQMFLVGLGIALPIFSVLVIADVLMSFMAKTMPQMNIFMIALPFKIYLGLILFLTLIQPLCSQIHVLLEKYLASIISVLGG